MQRSLESWREEEKRPILQELLQRGYQRKLGKKKIVIFSKRKTKTAVTNIAGLFFKTGHMMPGWHISCVHVRDEIIKDG